MVLSQVLFTLKHQQLLGLRLKHTQFNRYALQALKKYKKFKVLYFFAPEQRKPY